MHECKAQGSNALNIYYNLSYGKKTFINQQQFYFHLDDDPSKALLNNGSDEAVNINPW